jgi:hypothetical protein
MSIGLYNEGQGGACWFAVAARYELNLATVSPPELEPEPQPEHEADLAPWRDYEAEERCGEHGVVGGEDGVELDRQLIGDG